MDGLSIKCPNCGGGLQFDPAAQDYECEYCLSRFTQKELEQLISDTGEAQEVSGGPADGSPDTGTEDQEEAKAVVYTCPSCGAEIVTDETTAASFCFYCHNPVILAGRLDGRYRPDYVIPFAVDREKATEIFLSWLKQKRYVPKDFYGPGQIEKMTGVYFPYWLYSCQVDGSLEGEGTKLRTWRTGNLQYTETQKYDVSRRGTMDINHVTRNALKKSDKRLVEGVMPFDMKERKPFSIGFLSGFVGEKRDREQQEFSMEVETEVREFAAAGLKSGIGNYSSLSLRKEETVVKDPRWEYALLPVWTLTYKDKKSGKIYYFACNGQNGKVCGVLPVDPAKLGILFAEIFLPFLAVLLTVGWFL